MDLSLRELKCDVEWNMYQDKSTNIENSIKKEDNISSKEDESRERFYEDPDATSNDSLADQDAIIATATTGLEGLESEDNQGHCRPERRLNE